MSYLRFPDDETTTAEAMEANVDKNNRPTLALLVSWPGYPRQYRLMRALMFKGSIIGILFDICLHHPSSPPDCTMPPPAQTTDVQEFAARVQKAATAHSVNAHEFGKNIYDTLRITEVKLEDEDGAAQQGGKVPRKKAKVVVETVVRKGESLLYRSDGV